MAKWFSFPINLKNGTERVRSASESGPQTRPRHGLTPGTSLKGNRVKESAGGMGSILTGRNRKNSAIELGRNGSGTGGNSFKDGKIWDSLIPGKSRKNSKLETGASEEHRPTRTSSLAHAYISRMIKVDKQDKGPKNSGTSEQVGFENERGKADIKSAMDLLKVCVLLPKGDGEGGKPTPPHIYDTPYEGLLETEGEAGGVWIPVTRPESDPRPPGEQKTWNKKVLVPSPSSPTSPILKLSPPSPLSHSSPPSPTSHSSPTPKLSPSSSPPSPTSTPKAETGKVDPTLPMEKQSWYHGSVSRQQAEAQLQRCRDASFLSSCVFNSIPEVVNHYCTHRLPFTGAEHMTLQHPVPRPH
ncbi:unnamed protein product [Coregonus sp. 'balchen']|nr:unnamed protein product [Coregonus sp. 'balchen']